MGKKIVYKLDDAKDGMFKLREGGDQRGHYLGFDNLDKNYTMKEGSFTILVAAPAMGKTQFSIEIMMNMAEYEGWKWVIASPEMGSPSEIFAELCWSYARKPFYKINGCEIMSDKEASEAIDFVREHFIVIDAGADDMTIGGFYRELEEVMEEVDGIKGCLIDPYTEFKTDLEQGVRDDVAIGKDITKIRKQSANLGVHTIVAVHTKYQQPQYKKNALGKRVAIIPEPTFNDIAGGQMWSKKGFMIVSLWRCPFGFEDENGNPYDANQVKVNVLKAKPKSAGVKGHCYLYYNVEMNRYYSKSYDGSKTYSKQNPNLVTEEILF